MRVVVYALAISGSILISLPPAMASESPELTAAPADADTASFEASSGASSSGKRSLKRWFRKKMVRKSDLLEFGLRYDIEEEEKAPDEKESDETEEKVVKNTGTRRAPTLDPTKPLVVLLHGFNSTPDRTEPLFQPIREAGHQTATFRYPNDHELYESALLLSTELKRHAKEYPDQSVSLVCHSMGGLVARATIEAPELDPGNVGRLILVATPNQGSQMARLTRCADLWEFTMQESSGGPMKRFRSALADGLGEAVEDLKPGSQFLTELNQLPRNPNTHYTLLLGADGILEPSELYFLRKAVRYSSDRIPCINRNAYMRQKADQFNNLLADMNEVVEERGDGAVSVDRGRLEGVEDTVILPFSHLSVTQQPGSEGSKLVREAILERLDQDTQLGQ